jgi:predicted secreted hydrolase
VTRLLLALLLLFAAPAIAADFAAVRPGVAVRFPQDHGAHPGFRTEWWYATGWLKTARGEDLGFQITFFRTRTGADTANPSRFTPHQILFAHAALSDPKLGRLQHAQRLARAGFGLAEASTSDMDLTLDDWTMQRRADGRIHARAGGEGFTLDLTLTPRQPPLLQGEAGYSQKGPDPAEASHYYTLPQLKISGTISRNGKAEAVTGTGWLDREWSSTLMNKAASGWDWLGLNMADGGALTLFRMRHKNGSALWAGGSYRDAKGRLTVLKPGDVRFLPGRIWRSPRTGTRYPVAPILEVRLPTGLRRLPVTPLMDDQELDSRKGGGPVYWEGAVTVPGGRGYLEMTGYLAPLRM